MSTHNTIRASNLAYSLLFIILNNNELWLIEESIKYYPNNIQFNNQFNILYKILINNINNNDDNKYYFLLNLHDVIIEIYNTISFDDNVIMSRLLEPLFFNNLSNLENNNIKILYSKYTILEISNNILANKIQKLMDLISDVICFNYRFVIFVETSYDDEYIRV
jgi:hypothetical protein